MGTTKLLWTNRLSSHLPTPCRLIQLLDYHHHLPNINFAPSITCKLTRVSLTGPTQSQNSLIITFTIKKLFSPLNPDNPGLACSDEGWGEYGDGWATSNRGNSILCYFHIFVEKKPTKREKKTCNLFWVACTSDRQLCTVHNLGTCLRAVACVCDGWMFGCTGLSLVSIYCKCKLCISFKFYWLDRDTFNLPI